MFRSQNINWTLKHLLFSDNHLFQVIPTTRKGKNGSFYCDLPFTNFLLLWYDDDPLLPYVAHEAETRDFHSLLSVAIFSTSFHVSPIVFISASFVLLHVSRGRPRFLLPLTGIHLGADLVMQSQSFRISCSSYLHLRGFITVVMSRWGVFW